MKDFSRSQAVTYTVIVVEFRKRCNIQSLLLQTTNWKWYAACRILAIPMTLSHLQGHSPTASLSSVIFRTAVQQLIRFQPTWCVARFLCDSWASSKWAIPHRWCASRCYLAVFAGLSDSFDERCVINGVRSLPFHPSAVRYHGTTAASRYFFQGYRTSEVTVMPSATVIPQ